MSQTEPSGHLKETAIQRTFQVKDLKITRQYKEQPSCVKIKLCGR